MCCRSNKATGHRPCPQFSGFFGYLPIRGQLWKKTRVLCWSIFLLVYVPKKLNVLQIKQSHWIPSLPPVFWGFMALCQYIGSSTGTDNDSVCDGVCLCVTVCVCVWGVCLFIGTIPDCIFVWVGGKRVSILLISRATVSGWECTPDYTCTCFRLRVYSWLHMQLFQVESVLLITHATVSGS